LFLMAPVDRPRSSSTLPTVLSLLTFRGMFPTLLSPIIGFAFAPTPYYLILTRCTSQIIRKISAMTSKIQRIGPAKKPIEKPSNHKTTRIIPMIKSTLSILASFYLF
jgi:hypothetical protein